MEKDWDWDQVLETRFSDKIERITFSSFNLFLSQESNIRYKESCPALAAAAAASPVSRSGDPTWILKQGGLESCGQRLISSIGKTKGIALFYFFFFLRQKNIFQKKKKETKWFFEIFGVF